MNLLKISLIISLIGIFLLLIISMLLQPKQINIKEINSRLLDKKVAITGQIYNIKSYEDSNFQVISIKDSTGETEITIDKILNLKNNQTISAIGTINEYKNAMQLQADKIIILEENN